MIACKRLKSPLRLQWINQAGEAWAHLPIVPNSVPEQHYRNGNGMILAKFARLWSPGDFHDGTEIASHHFSTTYSPAH